LRHEGAAVTMRGLVSHAAKPRGECVLERKPMLLSAIKIGNNPPDDVNVVIEVPIGGEPIKYEIDKEAGALVVDRFLYTSMRYPGNYGFVPHTLSDDGDPCDVIVANTRAIAPGAIMNCRVVGVMVMEDEAGGDEKLIAVPSSKLTKRYDNVKNYTDLPDITLQQIEHFFEHYKDLEPGKWVKIVRWGDAAEAKKMLVDGIERCRAQKAGEPYSAPGAKKADKKADKAKKDGKKKG
jgi:inorganic pyrophosphatase